MRIAASFAVLALSCFPAAQAFADTFTFTPTGGSSYTFSTSGLTPAYLNTQPNYAYFEYRLSGSDTATFYTDTMANYYSSQYGYGHFNFSLYVNGQTYLEDGPQLFAGAASAAATFLDGTYTLVGDRGTYAGGTLVIASDPAVTGPVATPTAAAVTPEPSSCALFGTGLLSLAGLLRRRRK